MDGISWIGGKSEDSPKLMGERLGLYICAAGGALFGTMTWGAALATQKYADEIRRSCARNEALVKKNTSKLDDIVRRLSAVNSGLNGSVLLLNDVSGAMQRGWKQNVSESRRVSDETAARLEEIADANGQASHRVEQAAAKLEDTQKQQGADAGRLAAMAVYSREHLDGIESSMKLERQNIEGVVSELSTKQRDLTNSVDGVNAATVKLKTAHEDLLAGMHKFKISQREWRVANNEKIDIINNFLHKKRPLKDGLQLSHIKPIPDSVKAQRSLQTSLVAKKGNADKSDSSSQHNLSENSYDADKLSSSGSDKSSQESDASFDPDRDAK